MQKLSMTLVPVIMLIGLTPPAARAQQTTGVPGSPSATTTLDGRYLPNPPASFGGVINLDAPQSKPYWSPSVVPPKGAPNVLLILTDDVGFGAPSTFGGLIPTPALDRVAQTGLRYTNFHTTALCSPTRAALITGRNHHSVGFGVISELSTGYPGYDSIITKDKATIGTILRDNGYATSWFGKNHNTPSFQLSVAGPFDQWPLGMGFEYFYGFMGGETDQWNPGNLVRNTTLVYPYVGQPDWNLGASLADDAIDYLNNLNAVAPNKPFLLYFAPGGTHAPHQPPPEWIAKFKGKFDMGWNAARDQIFANQKRLGVIPATAKLTPWPEDLLKKWYDLTPDEKKLFSHQMEVYAAYLAYTDYQIGRLIQEVENQGKLDNTLIIYISGDNGSSPEGSLLGTPNEMLPFNGIDVPVADQLKLLDVWGSKWTYPHMAVGWTWAMDTPFKWTKQVASYFGGTRNGMTVSWPGHITDTGGIRNQFQHVIDVVPTILEAAGISAPVQVDGIGQKPIEGVSLEYTFDRANAEVGSARSTQYFEMFGNRALYHDGWIATTLPYRAPWAIAIPPPKDVVNGVKWELFNLTKDWTENDDVAAANPGKLRELQDLFWIEANKYQVLPLDASAVPRILTPRPSTVAGRNEFVYTRPVTGILSGNEPNMLNRSYTITASVEVPDGGGDGMLVTDGGRVAGFGLYLLKGRPIFLYNLLGVERFRWEGTQALTPGAHTISFDFKYDGPGFGKGGAGVLSVDGKPVDQKTIPHTVPFTFGVDESFDIGSDTGSSVEDKDYQPPFRFNGTFKELRVKLEAPQLSAEENQTVRDKNGQRD